MLLLALLLGLVGFPSGGAQAGMAEDVVVLALDDAAGDTQGPAPAEGAGFADLIHVDVTVARETLDVRFAVANLDTRAAAPLGWEMWLAVEYRGSRLDAVIRASFDSVVLPPEQQDDLFGTDRLTVYRMDGDAERLDDVPAYADAASRSFNATVPLGLLTDPSGFHPRPGEPLRILEAATFWSPIGLGTPHNPFVTSGPGSMVQGATDSAAFEDGTTVSIPGAMGDLSLGTPLAIRYSNGEATTFHWAVEVANQGDRTLDVDLGLETRGLEARMPPGVRLGPGENRTVAIYVTVPFRHDHGSSLRFPLVASAGTADRASLQLGVDYPTIPQPAGHHPDLYLHGRTYPVLDTAVRLSGDAWMNTAEQDERAEETLFSSGLLSCPGPQGAVNGGFGAGLFWRFPLDPGLRIGLDGRVGEAGTLDLTFEGPMPSAKLYARLVLEAVDAPQVEIFANATDPYRTEVVTAAGAGPTALALPLPIPPELDLVPPGGKSNLALAVLLCPEPAPVGFALAAVHPFVALFRPLVAITAGHAVLPLDEYHDAIPVLGAGDGLTLSVTDPVRRAAPGSTVLWRPALDVAEGTGGPLAVRLFGNAAPHARLLAEPRVIAQDTVLPVALTVPDEPAGTILDLLLDVTDEADPARSAAVRLSVLVDPAATADDSDLAAGLAPQPKESPGPTAVALGALLLLVAWPRRRGR